jgi:hypothetical protein
MQETADMRRQSPASARRRPSPARRVDELGQLRPDPLPENGRVGARPVRYRPHHAGRGLLRQNMRLFQACVSCGGPLPP